jgi:aerobic-type carbon monoxide dehydrogenase small subunit (CoxS/CutS family)
MSTEVMQLDMRVNGQMHSGVAQTRTLLCDFLRYSVGFTGVHVGCEHGVCGACTVLLDGAPVRSCLMFAVQVGDAEITTIEALSTGSKLHPLQEAFRRNHGLQCGFCTPGMVLTALDLLRREPQPDETRVREALSGSLCRCTGYEGIVAAVLDAAAHQSSMTRLQIRDEDQGGHHV